MQLGSLAFSRFSDFRSCGGDLLPQPPSSWQQAPRPAMPLYRRALHPFCEGTAQPASIRACGLSLRPKSLSHGYRRRHFTATAARRTSTTRLLRWGWSHFLPRPSRCRCTVSRDTSPSKTPHTLSNQEGCLSLWNTPTHMFLSHARGTREKRDVIRADDAAMQGTTIARKSASPSHLRMSTGRGGLFREGGGEEDKDDKGDAERLDNIIDSPLYRST